MKCRLKDCELLAQYPYPCCSTIHGLMYNVAMDTFRDLSKTNARFGLNQWNWHFANPPTVEDYTYYMQT